MEQQTTKIFGIHTVIEAINSGQSIDKIFIQNGLTGKLVNELKYLIKKQGITANFVPVEKLNRLTKKNHQGVFAYIAPVRFHKLENLVADVLGKDSTPLLLLLDNITDVRNFGAIIRTAECCGVHGIIIPKKGGAPVNADTVKTASGAVFNIPICKVDHIRDAVFYLQASDIQVVAATEKTKKSVYHTDLTLPTAIVMGSEEKGVSPSVLKTVDFTAHLPLYGETGSLNVSVACGVFLYETLRQRNLPKH